MMSAEGTRARLRELLARPVCVTPASVFDPLSTRVADELAFDLAMFAGSSASLTILAAPDLMILSLTEFVEQARRICRVGEIPLLVDADHGYGNSGRAVRELEAAGVAGLSIEDTQLPAPAGAKAGLVSQEEGLARLNAALAARTGQIVVAARTTPSLTDAADVLERMAMYEAAGADAIFLAGEVPTSALEQFAAATRLPIILGNAGTGAIDRERMAALGVRIYIQGHLPILAAVSAVYETMAALKNGTEPRNVKATASPDLMRRLTRDEAYRDPARAFPGGA